MNTKTVRWTLLAAVVVAAVVAAGTLLAHRDDREWTTDSEAALAEFERGLDEQQRLYRAEATEHFERAIELDPDFAAAKYYLLPYLQRVDEDRAKQLAAELGAVDRSRLSPRERLLIEHYFAVRAGDTERAGALLDDYLARHPDDPFVLVINCQRVWHDRNFAEAEALYRRLIEIDPNWVTAQNQLGYIAMAQGDWQHAEEQFEIYRYLAPDQANPHDSLGELFLLIGRWQEARREFEAALAIKPDFHPSWANLVTLELLNGRFEEAERIIDGIERDGLLPDLFIRYQRCHLGVWRAFSAADWDAAWEAYRRPECEGVYESPAVIAYEAALLAGRTEEAAALAEEVAPAGRQDLSEERRQMAAHMEGIRLRIAGQPEAAAERLYEVDRTLAYWNAALGYFKLGNRIELWSALRAAGRTEEAQRLLAEMRAVNADIAERWIAHPAVAPVPPSADDGRSSS